MRKQPKSISDNTTEPKAAGGSTAGGKRKQTEPELKLIWHISPKENNLFQYYVEDMD